MIKFFPLHWALVLVLMLFSIASALMETSTAHNDEQVVNAASYSCTVDKYVKSSDSIGVQVSCTGISETFNISNRDDVIALAEGAKQITCSYGEGSITGDPHWSCLVKKE